MLEQILGLSGKTLVLFLGFLLFISVLSGMGAGLEADTRAEAHAIIDEANTDAIEDLEEGIGEQGPTPIHEMAFFYVYLFDVFSKNASTTFVFLDVYLPSHVVEYGTLLWMGIAGVSWLVGERLRYSPS